MTSSHRLAHTLHLIDYEEDESTEAHRSWVAALYCTHKDSRPKCHYRKRSSIISSWSGLPKTPKHTRLRCVSVCVCVDSIMRSREIETTARSRLTHMSKAQRRVKVGWRVEELTDGCGVDNLNVDWKNTVMRTTANQYVIEHSPTFMVNNSPANKLSAAN